MSLARTMLARASSCQVRAWLALSLLLPAGCGICSTHVSPMLHVEQGGELVAADVDQSLILIGDAGDPSLGERERVLERLTLEARRVPEHTVVLFLGDNIYPDGLPPSKDNERPGAEARLLKQVCAAREGGARTIFIAGNHDHRGGGVEAVRREEAFLRCLGDPEVELLPADGDPGPFHRELGTTALLVVLDSEQWIDLPSLPPDGDPAARRLADLLAGARNKHVVVASHHPLASHGQHGGSFDWRAHLFPLTYWKPLLWVPLPIFASLVYVWPRACGCYNDQDLSHRANRRYQERLRWAFTEAPPLVHASGHEHGIQVFREGERPTWLLVSGAGSESRPESLFVRDDTLLASPFPGFLRIDFMRDKSVRCELIEVADPADGALPSGSVWWLATGAATDS